MLELSGKNFRIYGPFTRKNALVKNDFCYFLLLYLNGVVFTDELLKEEFIFNFSDSAYGEMRYKILPVPAEVNCFKSDKNILSQVLKYFVFVYAKPNYLWIVAAAKDARICYFEREWL